MSNRITPQTQTWVNENRLFDTYLHGSQHLCSPAVAREGGLSSHSWKPGSEVSILGKLEHMNICLLETLYLGSGSGGPRSRENL